MTKLRKVLPLFLLALAMVWTSPHATAQNNPDCSFTFTFTADANGQTVSNLSQNTPCVNWRVTLSATGSLTTLATFQTSPDGVTWTAVPNTLCSTTAQPPCIIQGANPINGSQGMVYMAAYGSYVRVITSGSAGAGTGTIRAYGSKGSSPSASIISGGGGAGFIFQTADPLGPCTVGTPNVQNTVTGAQYACVGPAGPNAGTYALIIAANSNPLNFYYTNTASSIATYLQATATPFSPKTTLTFAAIPIGTTAFQNWATNAGIPGLASLPAGVYTQHIHALKSAGGNATLHTQFWEVSATGVDIAQIGQTEETGILPGAETEFTMEFVNANTYVFQSTASRVVGRVFATITGIATSIQIFVGGTADTHMSLPSNTGSAGASPCTPPAGGANGTVAFSALTAAAASQEITIETAVSGNFRYYEVLLSETTQFAGTTGLTVSMGRPGPTTHAELTNGILFPLMVSSGDANYVATSPIPPQITTTYDVVLNFAVTAGNVNAANAGLLTYEVCGYAAR